MKAFHEARDTYALIHAYQQNNIDKDEWFTEESDALMRKTQAYRKAMLSFQIHRLKMQLKDKFRWLKLS